MNTISSILTNSRQAGRPLIGCFPLYPPLELLSSLGLTPVVLWSLGRWLPETPNADLHVQQYACSVGRRLAEAVAGSAGEVFDGLFMYNACDTLRNLPELLQLVRPSLPIFRIHVPQTVPQGEFVQGYLAREVENLIQRLEAEYAVSYSDQAFRATVEQYRAVRGLAQGIQQAAAQGRLRFADYTRTINTAWLSPIEQQRAMLQELLDSAGEEAKASGPKVMLSGIMPPPGPIMELIEQAGLRVAANDIASLGRSIEYTPEGFDSAADYYQQFYFDHPPCSTLLYSGEARHASLPRAATDSRVDGVIFVAEKFCEYEYFEFPLMQKALGEMNIPSLVLEIAMHDRDNVGAFRTRIEAFAELLGQ